MANPKKLDAVRDLKPVAVRISPEATVIFDIARAAYGHRSLQELLRPVLETEARRLAAIPQIADMINSAQALQARESGTVTDLNPATRKPKGRDRT